MGKWTTAVENYLRDEPLAWDSSTAAVEETDRALIAATEHAAGPVGVLRFWSARTQKLTSVIEQFKRKDVFNVGVILQWASKLPADKVPAALFGALRKWKDIEVVISEAVNEAK